MNEFLFLFRGGDPATAYPSKEEQGKYMQRWGLWIEKLSKKGQWKCGSLVSEEGLVALSQEKINDLAPLHDNNDRVNGFALIKIDNIDDAADIAKECPIFSVGGTIEIREAFPSPQ